MELKLRMFLKLALQCLSQKNGEYLGYVLLADELKEDAQPMVDLLHKENIEILLLTGDKEDNAKSLCQTLGIDRYVSELSPEGKTKVLEIEMEKQSGVAFIGDGINDAPQLKEAILALPWVELVAIHQLKVRILLL